MSNYPGRSSSTGSVSREHTQHIQGEIRRDSDTMLQREGMPIKLPSISSLTHNLPQSPGEGGLAASDARWRNDGRGEAVRSFHHEAKSPNPPSGDQWQHTPSGHSSSRADLFMSSLLRAARSPEKQNPQSSPMSVQSMLESPERLAESKSRKRPLPLDDDISEHSHAPQESLSDFSANVHRRIAMANPAAMAAHAQNTTFRPKPLNMSASRPSLWNRSPYNSYTSGYAPSSSTSHDDSSRLQSRSHAHPPHALTLQRMPNHPKSHIGSEAGLRHSNISHLSSYAFSSEASSVPSLSSTTVSGSSTDSGQSAQYQGRTQLEPTYFQGKNPSATYSHLGSPEASPPIFTQDRRWSSLAISEKALQIRRSILQAWESFHDSATQLAATNVTTIRCMHANIAQKSYGSEKRFLCPPPSIRIVGPLRSCRWATARVVPGDKPLQDEPSLVVTNQGLGGSEEEAPIDPESHEARFGKLHVGSLSESKNKTFRLFISLFGSNERAEDGTKWNSGSPRRGSLLHTSPLIEPWFSFNTSTINVISKPARKSIRTRAASPAIASGSTVCLYNRLNSQTVRTKYLAIEATEGKQTERNVSRLVARQDGWEGFSIELLAKPMCGMSLSKAGATLNDNGITYGSIICLRDTTTHACSDPMMVCKVDKGRVDTSGIVSSETEGKARFLIVGQNMARSRDILIGGSEKYASSAESSTTKSWTEDRAEWALGGKNALSLFTSTDERRESNDSSTGSSTGMITADEGSRARSPNIGCGSVGGAVIQMQKITLMHVLPRPSKEDDGIVECDLSLPRSYLCSTAFEGPAERQSKVALFRSAGEMQKNARARARGMETEASEEARKLREWPTRPIASTLPCPVGYMRPPVVSVRAVEDNKYVDVLEDPFCWTVVTISQSTVSYIEANARSDSSEVLAPLDSSPVMPFPTMSRNSTYDSRSHCISTLIHDFYYSIHHGGDRRHDQLDTTSAPHEIWLGQYGPLSCQVQAGSMEGHVTDAIFQLPSIDHMLQLYQEMQEQQQEQQTRARERRDEPAMPFPSTDVRLPILFVRPEQGLTFLSGYSIQLRRQSSYTPSSWRVSIEH